MARPAISTPAKSRMTRLAAAALMAAALGGRAAAGPCPPGFTLIGQDPDYYYCSRYSCDRLPAQIRQDQKALRRQMRTDQENSRQLQEWGKEEERAKNAALRHLAEYLTAVATEGMSHHLEEKLKHMQVNLSRTEAPSKTLTAKLRKIRKFLFRADHLKKTIDAIRKAEGPAFTTGEAWVHVMEQARAANDQIKGVVEAWRELQKDGQINDVLKEEGLEFTLTGLKEALGPITGPSVEVGEFLVKYGYDWTAMWKSRQRILAGLANGDQARVAECKLDRVLKLHVYNLNICQGRLPTKSTPNPAALKCD